MWLAREGIPLAAQIMMFFGGPDAPALPCACGCALLLFPAWPAARVADVTAKPERKSLRFMEPHFDGKSKPGRITLDADMSHWVLALPAKEEWRPFKRHSHHEPGKCAGLRTGN